MLKSRFFKTRDYRDHDTGEIISSVDNVPRSIKETRYYETMESNMRYVTHKQQYEKKYKEVMNGAKSRGITFELSFDDFKELMLVECFYCGTYPFIIEGKGLILHGIDRIDSSDHYHKYNCVSSCWDCNRSKNDSDINDFICRCKLIGSREEIITMKVNELNSMKEWMRTGNNE